MVHLVLGPAELNATPKPQPEAAAPRAVAFIYNNTSKIQKALRELVIK